MKKSLHLFLAVMAVTRAGGLCLRARHPGTHPAAGN